MNSEAGSQIPNPNNRAKLLDALYAAQDRHGWLSPQAIQDVANQLKITPGQVYSTASFYTMFKLQPQGRYHIQVCEGLSCYLVGGAEPLIEHLRNRLNIQDGDISPDGIFSIEVVQCLAACDLAPAIVVNNQLYGNVDIEKIDTLLADLE